MYINWHHLSETERTHWTTAPCYCRLMKAPRKHSKRPLLNESQISPNPIKLQKFTFADDGTKLVINDMTTISQPLPTEYELQFQLSADGFHPTYTVDQIKQSLSNCESSPPCWTYCSKCEEPQTCSEYVCRYYRTNNHKFVGRTNKRNGNRKGISYRSHTV